MIGFKHNIINENSYSEIFQVNLSRFFEMHSLYVMRLYALRLVPSKVSVDGFSLLYSKLFFAKLSFLYLVPLMMIPFGNLLVNVAVSS